MNFCEKMFEFPYRVYEMDENIPEAVYIPVSRRKWVVGYKLIKYEGIVSIADTFYVDTDIDDVIKEGFNASVIITEDDIYSCDWDLSTLKRRLSEHVKKVEEWEKTKKV